uniref:Uncharacterized protein n=1 Tax=Anguilla anguilla TaxID=7936 RepID=A0A0E9SCT7_ANGAN
MHFTCGTGNRNALKQRQMEIFSSDGQERYFQIKY